MRPSLSRTIDIACGLASLGGLIALWWWVTAAGYVSPFILPAPADVWGGLLRISGGYMGSDSLWHHLFASLQVVIVGFLAAVLVGVPLGIAMAWWRPMDIAFSPLLAVLRPVPPPAWIPLAILWFGIDLSGKVFVVFMSAFVPCLLSSHAAVRETPRELLDAARSLGAGQRVLLAEVAIPAGLPMILTGVRIALGNAWATVVAAELVVATAGFGYLIMNGYRNFEANIMAVGIIAIAVVGFVINLAFIAAERRILRWGPDHD